MTNRRRAIVILLLFCVNTVGLILALAYYSSTIQGISPLQYAGVIPTTFIEAETKISLTENFQTINFLNLGISGYDIYKMKVNASDFDITQTGYTNLTDSWDNWTLDETEIKSYGTDENQKVIGNNSLWYDIKPSPTSNTWIIYGNFSLNWNLSQYNALAIHVKSNETLLWRHGQGGGTSILFGTGTWDAQNFLQYDFNVTTDWQSLVIPFQAFSVVGKPSLAKIDYIIISVLATRDSPDYRIWIDELSFATIQETALYCNGLKINLSANPSETEIDNVWMWSNIYGYNSKEFLQNEILFAKSGPAALEITLFLRLYPRSLSYFGFVNFSDWSGWTVDSYVWDNMTTLSSVKLKNTRLVISIPEETFHAELNDKPFSIDNNKSTMSLYSESYQLRNVISIPIAESENQTLRLYSKTSWILAPFYFMNKALWMLQRFRGANYSIFLAYVLVSTVEITAVIFYKKRTDK